MNRGFSTIEILIAMALAVIVMTSIMTVSFGGQSTVLAGETNREAVTIAQQLLEQAQAKAKKDFATVGPSGPTVGPVYTTTVTVTPSADQLTSTVTALVTWLGDHKQLLSVKLTTLVTNPSGASKCSATLAGDWTNPQLLGYVDFGGSNGATDVAVKSQKAYTTANSSSAADQDFFIIDVSDPDPPGNLPIIAQKNTGPGLAAIAVNGNYAYVANISTVSQLQIININPSDPTYLTVVGAYDVPSVGTAVGRSIFYDSGKVYLGLTKSGGSGGEFNVIDVSTPSTPALLGSYKTNTEVNTILVKGSVAYVGTPEPTPATPEQENLSILDVSTPSSITRINTFTAAGAATMDGTSLELSKDGKTLYFGRTEGGVNAAKNKELFVLNVTTPGSIPAPTPSTQQYIGSTVSATAVRGHFVFTVTGDTNKGFQVWDLNTLGPTATPYGELNIQQTATGGMDCTGNYFYVAQRSNRALQIIGPGPINPAIATAIYNSANNPVTSVPSGTIIHDEAVLSGPSGPPTGTVDITLYKNRTDCSGGPKTVYTDVPLVGGVAKSPNFTTGANSISYAVHYNGDINYKTVDAACGPLNVF